MKMLTSMTNFNIQTNSADPDQTAIGLHLEQYDRSPHCLLQRHFKKTSRWHIVAISRQSYCIFVKSLVNGDDNLKSKRVWHASPY